MALTTEKEVLEAPKRVIIAARLHSPCLASSEPRPLLPVLAFGANRVPNSASTALARHLYHFGEKRISRPSEMADTAGIGGSAGAAYAFRGVVCLSRISTWCPMGVV